LFIYLVKGKMAAVFLTGFSGSLGSTLVEILLKRYPPDVTITCLVQIAQRSQAERRLAEIERANPDSAGRLRIVEGAVTLPDLGLGTGYGRVNSTITEVFHLVAVDERRKERDLATKVNLIGTQNLLSFAEHCPQLARFHYVSSCRVSGDFKGVFTENDLDKNQGFHNSHEETLFLAEMEVQRAWQEGMPGTIYRPVPITGSSQTGAISKDDELFDLIRWILNHASINVPVLTANPYRKKVHVIPVDYAAAALAYLSGYKTTNHKVYQLVDPAITYMKDFIRILGEVTGRRLFPIWGPRSLVQPLLHADPEVFDSFFDPTFTAQKMPKADLAGSGITCPPFSAYAEKMVDYLLAHPEIGR
jgi:thioester reductase-like protein